MSKRSKETITARILETCCNSASKTHIVYKAGLNFRTVMPYLELLSAKGMIELVPEKPPLYRTTPKGKKTLVALKQVEEFFS